MATLFEYKCKKCGYSVAANLKGHDVLMSGEIIKTPVPGKCPECGGVMKKTRTAIMVD